MRGDGGNHNEKQVLKIISWASQFTISDTAGTTPDAAGNHTDTTSSKPNEASRTLTAHICFYPPYRSHLHPPFLFLYHHYKPQS